MTFEFSMPFQRPLPTCVCARETINTPRVIHLYRLARQNSPTCAGLRAKSAPNALFRLNANAEKSESRKNAQKRTNGTNRIAPPPCPDKSRAKDNGTRHCHENGHADRHTTIKNVNNMQPPQGPPNYMWRRANRIHQLACNDNDPAKYAIRLQPKRQSKENANKKEQQRQNANCPQQLSREHQRSRQSLFTQ